MNYDYIEKLVIASKDGDKNSKEKLANEFKPFILNFSKKTFIHGYDIFDIQNECYSILFKCVKLYNPASHKFVGYAMNAIKNSIFYLIKKSKNRSHLEGNDALTFTGEMEYLHLPFIDKEFEHVLDDCLLKDVLKFIKELSQDEQDIILYTIIKNHSVKSYSKSRNISYTTLINKRKRILKFLHSSLIDNITN